MTDGNGPGDLRDRTMGELLKHLSDQTTTLVRREIDLAKAELAEKGKHAGLGLGLFGGAGAFAFYGVGGMVATGILLLALVLPAWLAALIVTVALFLCAAIMALVGKRQVSRAVPPVPEAAASGLKADVDTVKEAVRARANGHGEGA
jgi:uncharacterized membrane protein YqjE